MCSLNRAYRQAGQADSKCSVLRQLSTPQTLTDRLTEHRQREPHVNVFVGYSAKTGIHTDRRPYRQTHKDRHAHSYNAQTDTPRHVKSDRHADRHADMQTVEQTSRQTDMQTDRQACRQTDSASHLILDAEIELQLEVLYHEVLQAFLDDASQHDAKREAFEQLAAQQDLDGLPLSEQALGAINMLLPRLRISASPIVFLLFWEHCVFLSVSLSKNSI